MLASIHELVEQIPKPMEVFLVYRSENRSNLRSDC